MTTALACMNGLASNAISQSSYWLSLSRPVAKVALTAVLAVVTEGFFTPGNAQFRQIEAMKLAMLDMRDKIEEIEAVIAYAIKDVNSDETKAEDLRTVKIESRDVREDDDPSVLKLNYVKLCRLVLNLKKLNEYSISRTYQKNPTLGFMDRARPEFEIICMPDFNEGNILGIDMLRYMFQCLRNAGERVGSLASPYQVC